MVNIIKYLYLHFEPTIVCDETGAPKDSVSRYGGFICYTTDVELVPWVGPDDALE